MNRLTVVFALLINICVTSVIEAQCTHHQLSQQDSVTLAVNASGAAQITWLLNGVPVYTAYPSRADSGITVAGRANGISGVGADQLFNPEDLFVDRGGNLYIADWYNNRVQKWAPGSTSGTTVAGQANGANGFGLDKCLEVTGVFVDANQNVYAVDRQNHRVVKWAPGATAGVIVAGVPNRNSGSDSAHLLLPRCVHVDAQGNVYVTDMNNNRVQKWAPGATSGITVAGQPNGYTNSGSAPNQLLGPRGIWGAPDGSLYIVDGDNDRVQKWATGANTGYTVGGSAFNHVNVIDSTPIGVPMDVCMDVTGALYVSEFYTQKITKWMPGSNHGITIAGGFGTTTAATDLNHPTGIALDTAGSIYIADRDNNRVQKWKQVIQTTFTPTASGQYTAIITSFSGCRDTTGPVTFQRPNGISDPASLATDRLELYPNPFRNELSLTAVSTSEFATIVFYDVTGRQIKTIDLSLHLRENNTIQLNTNNLPAGLLFYTITTDKAAIHGQLVRE